MKSKATIVTVIAVVIGLGGGATVLSWARAQQMPQGASHADDHDHAKDDHGQAEPPKPCCEHAEHIEADPEVGESEHKHNLNEPDDQDEHEGHDHEAGDEGHDGHDDHGDESLVQLTDDERGKFGVEVATAGSGKLTTHIRLPGEIVLNEDRVAHIVPRAPGIVREVLKNVGDTVRAGEVMAWLESAELGEAKVDYLAKWSEVGCCTLDLTRAQEVYDNTLHLLEALDSAPSLETLRKMNGGAMGENRSVLVSAYAEFVLAKAAYSRERPLFEKKIVSERDYQAAEAEYKKADAVYAATRDSVGFKVQKDLLEAKQSRQVSQIELTGAKRRLYVLGLTCEDIDELELLTRFQADPSTQKSACSDPNCKDCKHGGPGAGGLGVTAAHEFEEKLAWYPLRAPFDGTVIEKHLTLGEKHRDDSGAFTVADLSSVWVDIAVYQKDLPYISKGMNVTVSAGTDILVSDGTIAYMAPVVDQQTRTALARVVLPNTDGNWRPGLFVNAEVAIGAQNASVVVPKSAIQRMGEGPVVFLDTDDGFKAVPVVLGRSNARRVEVLAGLAPGWRYVVEGAFELKAKIVTSGLGAHAGHGH